MKKFQRFCAAVVLTLMLALSAFAGDIPCPGADNPPPQNLTTTDPSNPGSGSTTSDEVKVDPITEAVLSLIQSVLPIL